MLVATTVLASLLLVAMGTAAVTRLSLARAYVYLGSTLVVLLSAITGNLVGAVGLETTVLVVAGVFASLTFRRRAKATRRRQRRRESVRDLELAA